MVQTDANNGPFQNHPQKILIVSILANLSVFHQPVVDCFAYCNGLIFVLVNVLSI